MDDPPGERTLSERIIPDGLDATLVLLRHGESTAIVEGRFQGQLDTPLSAAGRRQASLAAGRLARPGASPALPVPSGAPAEIVHSPLARAAETARAVAAAGSADDAFGRPVGLRPDPGFAEIGQGAWEGRPASEIVRRWGDVLEAWHRRPTETWAPGGESLADVQARVGASLPEVLRRLGGRRPAEARDPSHLVTGPHVPDGPWSILVAHAGVLRVVLLTLFDLPLERFWAFSFSLCGISVVELVDGEPRLRLHNVTEHLAPLLDEQAQAVSEDRERLGAL